MTIHDPDECKSSLLQATQILLDHVDDMQDCVVSLKHDLCKAQELSACLNADNEKMRSSIDVLTDLCNFIYMVIPHLSDRAYEYKVLHNKLMCGTVEPPFIIRRHKEDLL